MHRLSFGILAVVFLFIGGMVGVLVVRSRAVRPDPPEVQPASADYRVKEVRIQEQEGGNVQWKLDAALAEVFQQQGKTTMRNVTVTIIEPDRTWTVTSEEGDLFDSTRNVVLRKNVALVASDGFRLETDSLHWLAKEKRVWTDDPVTVVRDGAVVKGKGLDASMGEERTTIKGRVRATFLAPAREGPLNVKSLSRAEARNPSRAQSGPTRSAR